MKYARLVLRVVVSALFLFAAFAKFRDPHAFTASGYSEGFGLFIATAEACGAIGLWVPKVARLAAAGLSIIMLGAVYTLFHAGDPRGAVVPALVLFALLRLVF